MSKVRNIGSNQTMIERDDGTQVFVSYSTPVAAFVPGEGYLRTARHYSSTTTKHINRWAGKEAGIRDQAFFDRLV